MSKTLNKPSSNTDLFLGLNQLKMAERFIQVSSDGQDKYAIKQLMEDLGLKRSELAKYLDKTPQDLQSWVSPSAETFIHIKNSTDKILIAQLITLTLELIVLISDVKQLRNWLRLPNRAFKNQAPIDLILDKKVEKIIDELFPLISGNVST